MNAPFFREERQVQTVVILKNRLGVCLCVCVVFKGETRRNPFSLLLSPLESIVNYPFSVNIALVQPELESVLLWLTGLGDICFPRFEQPESCSL